MGYIFVSYSRKDIAFVKKLSSDLQKYNYDIWYDALIPGGESWADTLSKAIEDADVILVIISESYKNSNWALKELEIGMVREGEKKATVIPLLIEHCEPPLLLIDKVFIDFTNYETGIKQLSKTLSPLNPEIIAKLEGDGAIAQGENSKAVGEGGVMVGGSFEGNIVVGSGISGRDIINYYVEPREIEGLRAEVRQAVELFKSRPISDTKPEDTKTNKQVNSEMKCFIVMPFSVEALNVVYEDYVKPVLEDECGLVCERGDDVFGSNVIMDDILTSIKNSDLIVADLTGKNANVFYEVGICHALGKKVLLLAQSMDDVPFDLRHRRVLLYDYSPRGCKRLEKSLKDSIQAMTQ